jgi:hypothetical protein
MKYDLDIEIHGVTKQGQIHVKDGDIILLLVTLPSGRFTDLTDLLKCPDIYRAIEQDWLAYIANTEF